MNTEKLKKYVLLNLPYLLVFWFFDKLGWAYRLAPGVDFVRKLTGSVTTINAAGLFVGALIGVSQLTAAKPDGSSEK